MSPAKSLLVVVSSAWLLLSASAQDAPQPSDSLPTFRSDVKVVNVLATVRDKNGKIVNTLGKDDFTLEEDGRPQAIRYFSRETDLPLTLGLLVDTSPSQLEELPSERRASAAFVDEVLREHTDSAFLIHFDTQVELLQDLTSSPLKISDALGDMQPSPDQPRMTGGGYPGGRTRNRGGAGDGTHLYDAIFLASDDVLGKQKERKAIVVLTDGVDHGSRESLDDAIETAQRSDTIVYAIYFEGQENGGFQRGGWGGGRMGRGWPGGGWPGGGWPQPTWGASSDGKKVLERVAKETGGRMFTVSKKEPIEKIYQEIQDELRNQYNIGYTPDRAANAPAYHKIKVAVKQKDMKVQAREGYYGSQQVASSRR